MNDLKQFLGVWGQGKKLETAFQHPGFACKVMMPVFALILSVLTKREVRPPTCCVHGIRFIRNLRKRNPTNVIDDIIAASIGSLGVCIIILSPLPRYGGNCHRYCNVLKRCIYIIVLCLELLISSK